ncbi:MAG TPA: hypothetical protein VLY04_22205 [Bryobacteraceae bacterium]|nr:hypothetical protein [Bryobacteraceae bacterium]
MTTFTYRAVLRLYPPDHRIWFGAEMQSVFEEAALEHRGRGSIAYARFLLAEYAALAGGAAIAWAAKLAGRAYVHQPQPATQTALLPGEVQEAQDRLNVSLNGLLHAISHHEFLKARVYAAEEQKAREDLRLLREKYNIAE